MWSLIFMLIEAAIGAGIVLLGLVEGNASALRAGYIAVHLTNTMFLMGAMTGTIRAGTAGTTGRRYDRYDKERGRYEPGYLRWR